MPHAPSAPAQRSNKTSSCFNGPSSCVHATSRPSGPQRPRIPEPQITLAVANLLSPCAAFLPSAPSIWVSPARSVYVRPGKKTHCVLVQV
ncbi:hypothetical protein BKA56DRAFT_585208 [Ilyonectria sp. MPI-CAGE-AT-0026]|nr:hypothetical protein BKA56DRAFT_585208 [Ilyonectria sp. MPI-CAGE-AT-0026]